VADRNSAGVRGRRKAVGTGGKMHARIRGMHPATVVAQPAALSAEACWGWYWEELCRCRRDQPSSKLH
jgi:hypothetical protein